MNSINPVVIDKVRISNIEKTLKDFSAIKSDGGFVSTSQKFLLILYNNGDKEGFAPREKINIFARMEGTLKQIFLDKIALESSSVDSGEVMSKLILSLGNYRELFLKNEKYYDLVISCEGIYKALSTLLFFDRVTEQFVEYPRGASGRPASSIPFFNLSEENKFFEKQCTYTIEGISEVEFGIFVDCSCYLKYDVILYSQRKQILIRNNELSIRVPIYTQDYSTYRGVFFNLIEKYNPQLFDFRYDLETIKSIDESVIFDKYRVTREIYGCDFEKKGSYE